jgi:threonine dehydratase
MEPELTVDLVERVRPAVTACVRRTPMLPSRMLSEPGRGPVHLKCENLQVTGSFKVRGAVAALIALSPERRERGVVTASAGNHGLGLARAAAAEGVPCTVVLPLGAPAVKRAGIAALGARVVASPHAGYDATLAWTRERLAEWGGTFVSPFDDPPVMAGNGGTTFMEMMEAVPELDTIVVPCGGGGLSNGMGIVARERYPGVRIIGVNTDASPGMWLSRRDGRAYLDVESQPTVAEGIEGGVSERTYTLGLRLIDDVVVVPEAAVRTAVGWLATRERLVVEGAGAAAAAAFREGLVSGDRVGIVLTGGNIDGERLAALVGESETAEGTPLPTSGEGSTP